MTDLLFSIFPRKRLSSVLLLISTSLLLLQGASTRCHAQDLKPSPALQRLEAGKSPTASADFIVAIVNSEPITNSELKAKWSVTEKQMIQQGIPTPPRAELIAQVLERLINDKAQLQMARTAGIRVDESAVEDAAQTVARQNQVTPEELKTRLKAEGIDYQKFRSELRDELLVSRLRQREVEPRVVVSERDIDQFLAEPTAPSASSAALHLAEILIAVPENATPEQIAQLQAKAMQVMQRAKEGADFAVLATEVSESTTRSRGGQMGLREAQRYPPLFVEATKNLAPGGLAGPVRSGAGFHILKVIEKVQSGPSLNITQTHARHILLRTSGGVGQAQAISKLASWRQRILSGQADFSNLAREYGEDGTAKEGGDLGWVNPGMFVPEFEAVMNRLEPNQISEPLVSRFGVHLVQVLERRQARLTAREQREMARDRIYESKLREASIRWAQDIRGRAYVEYREPPY